MPKYFLAYSVTIQLASGTLVPSFGNIVTSFDGDLDDGSMTAQHLTNFETGMKEILETAYEGTDTIVSGINVINWKRLD